MTNDRASYAGREFVENDFTNARFRNVDLSNAKIRGAIMTNVDLDGIITGLVVNGIEVEPLIQAEKIRRRPELAKLQFADAAGAREAWTVVESTWARIMAWALALPEATLRRSVDREWSFLETLRHLAFATEALIGRAVLGLVDHYSPFGLPASDMPPSLIEACGLDLSAEPSLAEILELRQAGLATVRGVVDVLSDQDLERPCEANMSPGYPIDPTTFTVGQCLIAVIHEEWEHHDFAVRDLATLS